MHFLDPHFLIETLGIAGVVGIIFAESGLLIGFFLPGDSLLFTAGLLASQGYLSIALLAILCPLAAILGDNTGYAIGKKVGPKIFRKEESFFFNKKHIERSKKFFEKYGPKAIVLARFIPIVRTFTPIIAGVGEMPYSKFLFYNASGGILWTLFSIVLGYTFGQIIPNPDKYLLPVIGAIIIISFIPPVVEYIKIRKEIAQ